MQNYKEDSPLTELLLCILLVGDKDWVSSVFQALHFGRFHLWWATVMLLLVILGLCYLTYSWCRARSLPGLRHSVRALDLL